MSKITSTKGTAKGIATRDEWQAKFDEDFANGMHCHNEVWINDGVPWGIRSTGVTVIGMDDGHPQIVFLDQVTGRDFLRTVTSYEVVMTKPNLKVRLTFSNGETWLFGDTVPDQVAAGWKRQQAFERAALLQDYDVVSVGTETSKGASES